jgi:hypothetical protein
VVLIRVDLSSSERIHSPPIRVRWRSCRGCISALVCWSSSGFSKSGELWFRFVLTCLPQFGWSLLHHSCSRGHVEMVTVLLSAGASIEVQTKVRRDEGSTRVVFISLCVRMERLLFTLRVIKVLWEWSLLCWQQALKSKLEIR